MTRLVYLGFLSLLVMLSGCTSEESLVVRLAAKDFKCPEDQIYTEQLSSLDGFTARGCSKSELYVLFRSWGFLKAAHCPSATDPVWESGTKPSDVHRGQCARLRKKAGLPTVDVEWWWDDIYACPVGTKMKGGGPPNGTELWCDGPFGKNGPYTTWWSSGTKKTEGHYFDGISGAGCSEGKRGLEIKHGKWKYWDSSGNLTRIEVYKDGRVNEVVDYEDGRPSKR